MSFTEIVVVIGGLFVGYWVVSKLLLGGPGAAPAPGRSEGGAPAGQASGAQAWHEVLKVAPDASVDQIRESYKVLMSQYHPDKVATLGEELRNLAETRTKEITAAYRAAMRAHGQDA